MPLFAPRTGKLILFLGHAFCFHLSGVIIVRLMNINSKNPDLNIYCATEVIKREVR